jgi:hypothetical protein
MSNPEDQRVEWRPSTEDAASTADRRRSRPASTSIPILRLASLLVMLGVIGLTIWNLNGRGMSTVWGPAKQQDVRPVEKAAATPAKNRKPVADEDPKEFEEFRLDSGAILDKATVIRAFELPAYWRMLNWVESQSLADLRGRSFPSVPFQDIIQHPSKHRGRPVRVELLIRRVVSFEPDGGGKDSRPKKLYELWGWPAASDGWLYVVVAPELPPGFPTGKDIEVTTTVYGYFFKLQGYQPADAKPNARPLVAPLIIGRVAPVAVAAADANAGRLMYGLGWSVLVLAIGGAILLVVILGWIITARRRPTCKLAASMALPDTMDEVENG